MEFRKEMLPGNRNLKDGLISMGEEIATGIQLKEGRSGWGSQQHHIQAQAKLESQWEEKMQWRTGRCHRSQRNFSTESQKYLHMCIYTHIIDFPHSSVGKESACNTGDPGSIPGLGRCTREGIGYPFQYSWTFLVAQVVKNPPAVQETWVWSLGWEDPLEKGKAIHSSILAWRIPWTV